MRGSTPLDVAASSVMDNNGLALALEEPDLDKVRLSLHSVYLLHIKTISITIWMGIVTPKMNILKLIDLSVVLCMCCTHRWSPTWQAVASRVVQCFWLKVIQTSAGTPSRASVTFPSCGLLSSSTV